MPAKKNNRVHGDMLIGEVLSLYPEAAELMQDFGLQCVSCSVNVFEPLKAGAMSHGLEEKIVDDMISRINAIAEAKEATLKKEMKHGFLVTLLAAQKIQEFATNENKTGWGIQITAEKEKGDLPDEEPIYGMDFKKIAGRNEKKFTFHKTNVFVSDTSLKNLLGATIDYIDSPYGSGFKISNPRFKPRHSCQGDCGGDCECKN